MVTLILGKAFGGLEEVAFDAFGAGAGGSGAQRQGMAAGEGAGRDLRI